MNTTDIIRHFAEIARRVLGEPNPKLSTRNELRFGRNGSVAVEIAGDKAGTWYDHENSRGGGVWEFLYIFADVRGEEAWDWLAREIGIRRETNRAPKQEKVATYTYRDERGQTLFWVYRWGPHKTFTQAQPPPLPGAAPRKRPMEGCRYVPYHLDQLSAAAGRGQPWRVYIVEGEKDADRLVKAWGVLATTNAGGAGKWRKDYARYFVNAEVVILPDNDEAGREHAQQVSASLLPVAASVRVVALAGLPEKGDISDWLDSGGTQGDLDDLIDGADPLPKPPPPSAALAEEIIMQAMAEMKMRPVDWLWPDRIAKGKLSLIAGHPGLGKSQAALWLAATVSTGGHYPDGSRTAAGRVLILSAEDDVEDTILPRLVANGAELSMIHVLHMVRTIDQDGQPIERGLNLREDLARVEAVIEKFGDVAAVIIDPITAYLGDDIDSHQTVQVRAVLRPWQEMAGRRRSALIGITHLRKNTEADAVLLVTGSLAFVAAARATYFVMRDDGNPQRRLFLTAKNNLGVDTTGFAYALEDVDLGDGIRTSRVVWEIDPVTRTADEELARRRKKSSGDTRKTECAFLRELLAEGPVAVKIVQEAAKAAGLAWGTVRRAAGDLDVVTSKAGIEDGAWEWRLP